MPKRKMPKRKKEVPKQIIADNDFDANADTDIEMDASEMDDLSKSTKIPSLFRLSSRVASMKRRGYFYFYLT